MLNYIRRSRQVLCAATILATLPVMPFSVQSVWAQDEAPIDMARPGAKNDDGVVNTADPMAYPDLSHCPQLADGSVYRGGDRIMRVITPGTDGWLYRSLDFRTDFSMPEKTINYMKRVNDSLKSKGIDLYIVLQPSRAMVVPQHINPANKPEGYDPKVAQKNYQALISELQDIGIQTTDLSNPPDDFEYFFRGDPHWRREGSKWTADQISKVILKNPYFKGREKELFSNEITWWLESEKGEFDEFVEKTCNVTIPPERRPMWATTALAEAASEDALFGDVTYPDIVIVGTSNTAHEEDFNFVGSLKMALSADIRNRALSAAGFSGASVVFFATEEFHEHPPKILIWEFLAHHIFDDYAGFRQMVPALEGGCSDEEALAVAAYKVNPPEGYVPSEVKPAVPMVYGPELPNAKKRRSASSMDEVMVFDSLEDKQIPAKGHYVYVEVTEPEIRNLSIGVLYDNGDAEEVDVSRSLRAENNGKYYLEFDQDLDANLMLLQIGTDKPEGKIKARICKYKKENI